MPLPYFVQDFGGVGGTLKQRPEDFIVHEVPRYQPTGEGEHVMFEIEKIGLSTLDAVDHFAKRLKVPRRSIGYAGLKDTHAVTRQWLTAVGTTPEAVADAAGEKVKVLYIDRHRNKLRVGHLAGNRFRIRLRDVDPMKVVTLGPALKQLAQRGVPNYFGEQRFGRRGNNDQLGAALLRGDAGAAIRLLLGGPDAAVDDAEATQARALFDAGDHQAALDAWPRRDRDERAALVRFIRTNDSAAAISAVGEPVRRLWASALQSRVFNDVVARRITAIDGLLDGDVAYKHENGACFAVADIDAERLRAAAFEISATGPLIGPSMLRPTGDAGAIEQAIFDAAGATIPADARGDIAPGARRPLRVPVSELSAEAGMDAHGGYILTEFTLPPGAYATVLLRELMRNDAAPS